MCQYTLHICNDAYYILDVDKVLVIDRVSHDIYLRSFALSDLPLSSETLCIHGIIGIISLLSGPYLIVITSKSLVGTYKSHDVWRLDSFELLSFSRCAQHLNNESRDLNSLFVSMIKDVLSTPYFYFSYTQNLSSRNSSSKISKTFCWNYKLLQPFLPFPSFVLPMIHGYFSMEKKMYFVNSKAFRFGLLSRRSTANAGTRFFYRGINSDGNVSNFVETEQILEIKTTIVTFTQTRGSLPFYWTQIPSLKYMPTPIILPENHEKAFHSHFEKQINRYGPQVILNLVNSKGYEGPLGIFYSHLVSQSSLSPSSLSYIAYDFHGQKDSSQFNSIKGSLVQRLRFMGFSKSEGNKEYLTQKGVFRTNCMDCLDRTNVIQSFIASLSLMETLKALGVLESIQNLEDFPEIKEAFSNMWANHGDILSLQYAGTGAMKSDVTRRGRRTWRGRIFDGLLALRRYIKNNFYDGGRYDALQLFLGAIDVPSSESPRFYSNHSQNSKCSMVFLLPLLFLVCLSMFFATFLFAHEITCEICLFLGFWSASTILILSLIYKLGKEFVNTPKLLIS